VNGRWLEYIGQSWEEYQASGWASLLHPDDLPRSREYWEATVASGQPAQIEHRVRRADGQYRWLLARGVPLRDELGQIVKWYGTVVDIDERKRANDALQRSAEELKALSRRLVELQETERRCLARELHDRVGQNLTALHINLGMLRAALSSRASGDIASRLDDCAALLESTARDIRCVESELRPPMLDDHGLLAALHWYANEFTRRVGIAVSVHGSQGAGRAGPEVELALFRIAQEALNNVAKHAHATSVVISFGSAGSEFRMSVVDDGVGLRPHAASQARTGFGLVTMRERAQAIGGRFNVEGLPQGGMRITVQVPA
jgi:two-component system sensor histidine kinase UhpB